ncbi:MAG: aminotransferase class I/II-fold pyridoxal phosphate-dependent enzyme [Bacteroidales bacterium]|nr:aminotransferase class I/II-fold pyridoxal phosphate-dependent enzyme [Bacteroidales bacterium]MCF8398622.1 aminotransferase class I/II-fold pyridoxal phosphate-dependent enzyme [Bacteroidales bacterium]
MSRTKRNHLHVHLNLNVRGLAPSATLAINEQCNKLIRDGKSIFRLGLGQSPFPVPESVVEALRRNAHQKDYLPVKGLPALKEAVASFNMRTQRIDSSPDDILIGPGSKELIFILQLVYYGDIVIPTPSWVSYSPQARIVGRHVNWVPAEVDNDYRFSPEKLDLICRSDPERPRVVILNYPGNPTGCTYPIERLKLLAQVARKYKLILVSDEIYGMIHHNGQHVSVARYYPEGTIVSSGLSKWCGAGGWRLGTFSFPPNLKWLLNAMSIVASETYTATSAPIQHAAVTAFNGNEEIDVYLKNSRKVLKGIAHYLNSKLEEMALTLPRPQGAFYLFPDFGPYREKLQKKGINTSVELCAAILEETGVAVLPGADFGREPEELTARIAYVDFDGKTALEGAGQLSEGKNFDTFMVKQYCPRLVEAFERIGNWLTEL